MRLHQRGVSFETAPVWFVSGRCFEIDDERHKPPSVEPEVRARYAVMQDRCLSQGDHRNCLARFGRLLWASGSNARSQLKFFELVPDRPRKDNRVIHSVY